VTANEAIAYIENYTWSTARLGLDRTRALLSALGDPQKELKFIHVAGSNGKGSTCAMLDSILRKAGYRVGLYTSPYIEDFCERIRVNGENIPGDLLAAITERVRGYADAMSDHPSQFELVTAIAMEYFRERGCDIVVLEVGMGGALDSTNAIDAPEVAVITNIGLEHTEYLGNTLSEIASAKAGIIKPGCACVSYDSTPEVIDVVRAVCEEKTVPLTILDFSRAKTLSCNLDGQCFLWNGTGYRLNLLGPHQVRNAAVVLETVEALRRRGWNIDDKAVSAGLRDVTWPARMEVLNRSPLFILDGGHNPQCAQALAACAKELLPGKKAVFLIGVLADKDYAAVMDYVLPLAQAFICLTPLSDRALPAEDLADYLTARGARAEACEDISEGIKKALTLAGEDNAVIAFGSLYLAGAIRSGFAPAYRKWLRKTKILARDSLSPEERTERSERIAQRILRSEAFQRAKTVMIYKATRGEVRLEALENTPEARDKRLVYPLCVSDTDMIALLPHGDDAWSSGYFGIAEPVRESSAEIPPEEIDLVICPCTVFDDECHRMGMGAGFYDRYLPHCKNARVAAVAFECQRTPAVPTAVWDKPMDMVFTENSIYQYKDIMVDRD